MQITMTQAVEPLPSEPTAAANVYRLRPRVLSAGFDCSKRRRDLNRAIWRNWDRVNAAPCAFQILSLQPGSPDLHLSCVSGDIPKSPYRLRVLVCGSIDDERVPSLQIATCNPHACFVHSFGKNLSRNFSEFRVSETLPRRSVDRSIEEAAVACISLRRVFRQQQHLVFRAAGRGCTTPTHAKLCLVFEDRCR